MRKFEKEYDNIFGDKTIIVLPKQFYSYDNFVNHYNDEKFPPYTKDTYNNREQNFENLTDEELFKLSSYFKLLSKTIIEEKDQNSKEESEYSSSSNEEEYYEEEEDENGEYEDN
jgi:hypothetical protein